MPPLDSIVMHSRYHQGRGGLIGMFSLTGQRRIVWCGLLSLALAIVSTMTGCGGGGGSSVTPEQTQKQEVVQDKMKDFMKQSKLPNRPR